MNRATSWARRIVARLSANFRYRRLVRDEARILFARLSADDAIREARRICEAAIEPAVRSFAYNVAYELRVISFEFGDRPSGGAASREHEMERFARERISIFGDDGPLDLNVLRNRFRQALLSPVVPLTDRQMECLDWAAQGKSSTDIAEILGLSKRTVDEHLESACEKLGVRTRIQAVGKLEKIRGLR